MKKISISFILIAIIILSAIGINLKQDVNKEYLRVHIRANSNEQIDQRVKYEVKNQIVKYLTPKVSECKTKDEATKMLEESLSEIELVTDRTLLKYGFSYCSKASIRNENFPTRTYDTLTLEAGYYDALIVELGDGKGDNWWCVVYPPLCFTGEGENYRYKSKIMEIINDFNKNHQEE